MKKSQISYFIVYLIIASVIVVCASIFTPLGSIFTDKSYVAGHSLMLDAKSNANYIRNTTIRTETLSYINSAIAKESENIDLSKNFFKYSWIIILILSALIIFVFARYFASRSQGGLIG